ncbi:hypothetical protein AB0C76_26400 [Kitasatospora sp. NPDC048722]|uniref:hypothetical protein n=1 Tax=Kitasatospora sp. NPDC048722 TaxID=3155639 RepID=UPI003409B030
MPEPNDRQHAYRMLVDPGTPPDERYPGFTIAEPDAASHAARVGEVARRLEALFAAEPDLQAVTVWVAGTAIGVATATWYRPEPADGPPPEGPVLHRDGDRALLPGHSSRYVLFRYHCAACPRPLYSPAPEPPRCPVCDAATTEEP